MIKLTDIRKRYGDREVLSIAQWQLDKGRIAVLQGPNGAGKTTLLKVLALIEPPTTGRIYVDGQNCSAPSVRRSLRGQVTLVHQQPYLLRGSVEDNVAYGLSAMRISRGERSERIRHAVHMTGLIGFERRNARQLSAGESQRVALARALALRPLLLLMDEPAANADHEHTERVANAVRQAKDEWGATVVLATHDEPLARQLGHVMVCLRRGRIEDERQENLFIGRLKLMSGEPIALLEGNVAIHVADIAERQMGESVNVAIDPSDILVALSRPVSSARNVLSARVVGATACPQGMRIVLDVGVRLTALITARSYTEMGLKEGSPAFAVFKATAVKVW